MYNSILNLTSQSLTSQCEVMAGADNQMIIIMVR